MISFGGCVYRSAVHCAHAASLAALAARCANSLSVNLSRIDYQHSSNLPQGRSLWLRRAIDDITSDVAISVDSDTSFSDYDLVMSLANMRGMDTAIGIAPVMRSTANGTELNIFHDKGETILPGACGSGVFRLWAGGFGLAAFNLRWFRRHWKSPFPEQFGTPDEFINQGEDIQMCRSVISRGGNVIPLWIGTTHHDTSGHSIIGQSVSYSAGRMIYSTRQ